MMKKRIVLLWDNFGPLHLDRIKAVGSNMPSDYELVAVEICSESNVYDWQRHEENLGQKYTVMTLFQGNNVSELGHFQLFLSFVRMSFKVGRGNYFLCHWQYPAVFAFSLFLRISGNCVYTMGCSKFDDKPRYVVREWLKSLAFTAYQGAIGSGVRSKAYFKYMGIQPDRVVGEYNTVSNERIRKHASLDETTEENEPSSLKFHERNFLVVSRLVEKKNLKTAVLAYSRYAAKSTRLRRLVFCGAGPELGALRSLSEALGVAGQIDFLGFVQTEGVSSLMAKSLALILPSDEEQFGNVVPEALAVGLPVILSSSAGARDCLIRSGVNGFVVESDSPDSIAFFMDTIAKDPDLWASMTREAVKASSQSDVKHFAYGVNQLVSGVMTRHQPGAPV